MNRRLWILFGVIFVAVFVVYLLPAIPQNEAYHHFADTRMFLGMPNCLNVLSNAPFLLVGLPGMWLVLSRRAKRGLFVDPQERWAWFAFFLGVSLTAFGSSWYHLNPNDTTLVWDRLPMAVGFMSLLAAVVSERLNVKAGLYLLLPLIAIGAGSVLYWSRTQSLGHGDLRPYAITQFGSLLALILLIALFRPRYTRTLDLGIALAFYAIAKIFEAADKFVFSLRHIVSGHTIKHLFAALSTYWILRMLRLRTPLDALQQNGVW